MCVLHRLLGTARHSRSCALSRYNAKVHPHLPKLTTLLAGLSERISLTPKVVVAHHPSYSADHDTWGNDWTSFDEFVNIGKERKLGRSPDGEIEWARLGFDWPLWILFSSGTTGGCLPSFDVSSIEHLMLRDRQAEVRRSAVAISMH